MYNNTHTYLHTQGRVRPATTHLRLFPEIQGTVPALAASSGSTSAEAARTSR